MRAGRRRNPAGSGRPGAVPLDDADRVLVVGGGPAGAFFAITLLREARGAGRAVRVRILERRRGLLPPLRPEAHPALPGCTFCAGGISPRLSDVLDALGIEVPPGVVQNRFSTITVQSHWKNVELRVPPGRRLYSVYRGARPAARQDRHLNFDSLLLTAAAREGAEIVTAEVTGLRRSPTGRPVVRLRGPRARPEEAEAAFVAIATGVNHAPGADPASAPLARDLRRLVPGFAPPRTRRTVIFELELERGFAKSIEEELTFVLYGSRELGIEMGSIMPKGRFVTVALIGRGVERLVARRGAAGVVRAFLSLPHVERILPRDRIRAAASCTCRPHMVVGCARNPFGDRVAVIGDLATSRLYKDGLYSAYLTGAGLARALLRSGVDRRGLARSYAPLLGRLAADQRAGRAVFFLMGLSFRNPLLSRMTYQAVLRERRKAPEDRRLLEGILWRVASGDDSYGRILRAMFDPAALSSFLVRGALVTIRNHLVEVLFGLSWRGFGRYRTGVYPEDHRAKVRELRHRLGIDLARFRHLNRMYAIRVRAPGERIFWELGRLGDPRREFLRPRLVEIRRVRGAPNEPGGLLRYRVAPRPLSFHLRLERVEPGRSLVWRVLDGFPRGGLLVLDVEERGPSDCLLSVLVGFDIPAGPPGIGRIFFALFRRLFPTFVHDVLWNHALCRLKDVAERSAAAAPTPPSPRPSSPSGGAGSSSRTPGRSAPP